MIMSIFKYSLFNIKFYYIFNKYLSLKYFERKSDSIIYNTFIFCIMKLCKL
ncbi:protein of unknown function [Clostridium beijerinckii]|nr:protein of unknown function [Clostridium beijerinckii]